MELVLPNSYVELEQEEMMYVDGGGAYRGMSAWKEISTIGFWVWSWSYVKPL